MFPLFQHMSYERNLLFIIVLRMHGDWGFQGIIQNVHGIVQHNESMCAFDRHIPHRMDGNSLTPVANHHMKSPD